MALVSQTAIKNELARITVVDDYRLEVHASYRSALNDKYKSWTGRWNPDGKFWEFFRTNPDHRIQLEYDLYRLLEREFGIDHLAVDVRSAPKNSNTPPPLAPVQVISATEARKTLTDMIEQRASSGVGTQPSGVGPDPDAVDAASIEQAFDAGSIATRATAVLFKQQGRTSGLVVLLLEAAHLGLTEKQRMALAMRLMERDGA